MATRPGTSWEARRPAPAPAPRTPEFANDNAVEAGRPLDAAARRYASALPADAFAVIEPDPLGGRGGGRAREGRWRLRFSARSRSFVDPLTGWTGGCDPLAHLELVFPSREAAEDYCRRYGVPFQSRPGFGKPRPRPHRAAPVVDAGAPSCCMPRGPHPFCCGADATDAARP